MTLVQGGSTRRRRSCTNDVQTLRNWPGRALDEVKQLVSGPESIQIQTHLPHVKLTKAESKRYFMLNW